MSGGRSVWLASRLVWVRFPRLILCDSSFGFSRLLYWRWSFVGVVCVVLPCLRSCNVLRAVACVRSTLLILRAVYCLYIPALRNLTGF